MPLRLFTEDTSWEQARHDQRFTRSRLAAHDAHGKLTKPLQALLGDWRTVDGDRLQADDGLVDAHAVVSMVDYLLDEQVGALASRLRYELGGAGADSHPTFRAFFAEAPTNVIRLSLESEIARTRKFHHVAQEITVSPEVKAILKEVNAIQVRGQAALEARQEAQAAVTRVALRIAAWKQAANAARRAVETALDAHANTHHLPRTYAAAFFPQPPPKKKKEKKPA